VANMRGAGEQERRPAVPSHRDSKPRSRAQ
jgi:hypothetical protein